MKRVLVIALIFGCIFIFPSTVLAKEDIPSTGWTGHGLYLLGNQNIHLNKVDINMSVNADQTSTVEAEYELENKEDKTVNAYLGVPEHEAPFIEFSSWVSPYYYGNSKVSGNKINQEVKNLKGNYKNWRTWYAPFQAGENRTVKISYKVENKEISNGRYFISFQLDHINSWKGSPKDIHVNVYFDNKEVKAYNFGRVFRIKPDKIEENFTLKWSFDSIENNESIDFDYYYVDREIVEFLKSKGSSRVSAIATAYENEEYAQVIQQGKEYIQSSQGENFQKEIYFLMADAYLQLGQPEESLILYELIEGEPIFYEGLQQKAQDFIVYNKINCYLQNKDYKDMYQLILKIQKDKDYNFIFKDWANQQTSEIPQKIIEQVQKENRKPGGLEKLRLEISSGKYNNIIMIALGILALIISIFYIRYKRKKDKNTLFKK